MDDDGLRQADAILADLDDGLAQLRLPAAYRQPAYDARIHVELIRSRIAKRRAKLQTG